MPYALFTNDEQISKAYRTKQEIWKKADEAGLVVEEVSADPKETPTKVLDENYEIRPCPPDASSDAAVTESPPEPIESPRKRSAHGK